MSENVKGLKELLKKLDALGDGIGTKVEAILWDNAREIEYKAKRNTVPQIDTGKLIQSIAAGQNVEQARKGVLSIEFNANSTGLAPYAAYVEFGTGGLVNVPPELQDEAIKFKGKGIRQVNLRPRPYLYPALVEQRPIIRKQFEALLDKEAGKI